MRRKSLPDAPDLPPTWEPAPAEIGSGDVWDGVEAGAGVEVPEHVSDLRLQECRWTGADLSGRSFGALRVRDTEFVQCDLSGAVLDDAVLTRVVFTDCRLTGTVLSGAELTDVRISGCTADLAAFRMARASFLLVEDTSLRGADLYSFRAAHTALLGCDLTEAVLEDAQLAGTDLHGSTIADVRGALALRGCRISADQLVPVGAALLAALDVQITAAPPPVRG